MSWRMFGISQGPFPTLVRHFVKRLFASEQEQDGGGMGLCLGAVLAILASPGAFASIFLLDKYGTLLQWARGQPLDAIGRSPSDEYFFIVLSMTITGLVTVARWNRLFPDNRDFSNLAILPIPIRNIFLANFVALFGLAVLFAVDVNMVSAVLFPLFVTLGTGKESMAVLFRLGISHFATVLSSSLFSFFAVFGLVGLLILIVPRRIFRPVSLATRMVLVVALLMEFFSNLFLRLFAGRLPGQAGGYLKWLPPFWFLGIYERMMGVAKPFMSVLGKQALLVLILTIFISIAAYALCYRRYFLRISESLDKLSGHRRRFRLRLPGAWESHWVRSPFELACDSFAAKVLLRNEQHLMFVGAYFGVGLVLVTQTALDAVGRGLGTAVPNAEYLSLPFLVSFFVVSGLRFAFDMPASIQSNWVFQMAVDEPQPEPRQVAIRLLLWATIPWQLFVLAPITASHLGWFLAALHTATVLACTMIFIEGVLLRFRKIPFTCSSQLEIRQLLIRALAAIFAVFFFVPAVAGLEHWALNEPIRLIAFAAVLMVVWYLLRRYRREMIEEDRVLRFEDSPDAAFELIKLT